MYDERINPAANAATREAMTLLAERGVVTVRVDFSGGNDEGGPDGIEYFDAEGKAVDGIPKGEAGWVRQYNPNTGTYDPGAWTVYGPWVDGKSTNRPATDEEVKWSSLAQAIEAPIYERWGSFAGEFYVDGTLTWDVAAGTYSLTGQESVEHYEGFEYEG